MAARSMIRALLLATLTSAAVACSAAAPTSPIDPSCPTGTFDSTFAAIQKVIFEGNS